MHEPAHGRGLARLLAVLLGVVLWLPVSSPKLAQPSQPSVTCADADRDPLGEFKVEDVAPSQAREGEETEDGEDSESSSMSAQLFGSRLRLPVAGAVRVGVSAYERERLSAAHSVLARERGPPAV